MKHLAFLGTMLCVALACGFEAIPVSAQQAERSIEVLALELDRWPKVTARVAVPVVDPTTRAELKADELTIVEDARTLSSVLVLPAGVGRSSVSIVLAMDASSDASRAVKETTKTFLSQLGPKERVALVTFGDEVTLREPFTTDRWALGQRIDAVSPSSAARLADGLLRATVEAASTPPGSRAVVLVSSGRNVGSQTALTEGISTAVRAGVPVYAIALGNDVPSDSLQRIAEETRGRLLWARTTAELASAYQFVQAQVSSQFEVTWTTKLTADPGRDVDVELKLNESRAPLRGVRFSYKQPPFANISSAASGPALIEPIVNKPLELLPSPEPPNNVQMLQAGMVAGLGAIVLFFALLRKTVNQRLRDRLRTHVDDVETRYTLGRIAISPFALIASGALIRVLSKKQVESSREKLIQAGYQADAHLRNFMTAKLMIALVAAGYSVVMLQLGDLRHVAWILALACGGIGFLLPDLWLTRKIEQRGRSITRALPDALDMLSVGMSAGLSFDSTVVEVADKWHNPLTEELEITLREMRLGASRREALTSLARRTKNEDVRTLVTALVQADELGTSLVETLHTQAGQLRIARKHRAEEQAHKAAVKMLLPLVGLIFPALFVVILGPAVPKLLQSLGGI